MATLFGVGREAMEGFETWGFPKIRGTYYNGESNGKENGK